MKNKKLVMTISSVLATVVLATGCAQKTEEKKEENKSGDNKITLTYDQLRSRENTMGTLWYQNAAEVDALYQQGYNVATNKLKELLKQPTNKPYSIVLDIDETVLSNIPFQVKMIKDGTAFNPKLWDEWVQKAEATPVAGAKEFLQFADKNKVQIYYISDRTDAQVDATIKNLEAQGLPVQGRDHLMFKKEGDKSKEGRRQEVLKHTNLVMLFGDNLVDFAEFSTKSEADRDKMFEQLKAEFGDKFIIFPNPMYGSWESAVYQGEKKDGKGQSEARLNALKGY
ncbi:5'-nucleotidase, lipoprotein e(P4) family [Gemella haemolysans]|uniref:5'-nucleotidase, lipoprotein e(P4) family n=1 Tax=Gemella haemolysans TaxID=1379 RepID=A0A133ZUH1_9BACL|nr:5'-nucleotidase, lipoprotein e(P4) family [Gemella haemolysans]KXB59081.1 5'-nucleotidase, lipoprotein e(P4) family [Gemella haemolysans]TKW64267.1 MAG: 5'-nucleotidase, lipoprotein e(P4) family [Gemella sp.]